MHSRIFAKMIDRDMFLVTLHARRDGMLDVTEYIVVFIFSNRYILWKALKHYCLLG